MSSATILLFCLAQTMSDYWISLSYTKGRAHAQFDNARARASALSHVHAQNHSITDLSHLHACRSSTCGIFHAKCWEYRPQCDKCTFS